MTGHYLCVAPAAVFGSVEPFVLRKSPHMNILICQNTVECCYSGLIKNMLVKSVKYWTKKIKTYHLLQHLVFCVRYNIIKDSHHFGPPGIIVTSQSVLKHWADLRLRSLVVFTISWIKLTLPLDDLLIIPIIKLLYLCNVDTFKRTDHCRWQQIVETVE